MKRRLGLLLITLMALLPLQAMAQFPEKAIKMIVPYAPGGGADATARIIGQHLATTLGQAVIIENRPGAGGVIGADVVAKAPGDGYTLLFDASAFAANPAFRKLPYDAGSDFIPISLVVFAPNILVSSPQAPYKTVAEMIEFLRKTPEKANYASAGPGAASHLAGEALNHLAKLNVTHVAYRGGGPALTDVIADRVAFYFGNTASTLGQVTSGAVRALAIGSPQRSALLPDVPTLIESGLKDFETQEWNGVFAPKGTPPAVIERLAREIAGAIANPEVKARLEKLGLQPVGNTPAEFARFIAEDSARVAATVKARNITVD